MKQKFFELKLKTNGQKLYNFTNQTINWIKEWTVTISANRIQVKIHLFKSW